MLSTSSAEEKESCAVEIKASSGDEPQQMQEQIYWVTMKSAPYLRPWKLYKLHIMQQKWGSEAVKAILFFFYVIIAVQLFKRDTALEELRRCIKAKHGWYWWHMKVALSSVQESSHFHKALGHFTGPWKSKARQLRCKLIRSWTCS